MANKRTPALDSLPSSSSSSSSAAAVAVAAGLRPSDIPDVYLNAFNIPCGADGVALTFLQVKARDSERFEAVLGEPADTPAKFLKAVSLDPRMPLTTRIDAAKAAAPYSDRRQPTALDGGLDPSSGLAVPLFDAAKLSGLSDSELAAFKVLLAKVGAA